MVELRGTKESKLNTDQISKFCRFGSWSHAFLIQKFAYHWASAKLDQLSYESNKKDIAALFV